MQMKNFKQKTTQTCYKFRPFSIPVHSPAAAKKRQQQEQKGWTSTQRPTLSAGLCCCKIRKSVNTFTNLAREFTPLDPRRNKSGPEKSVQIYCSGGLAYE